MLNSKKLIPNIFLSYNRLDSDIADSLDNYFKNIDVVLLRDIRDVGFRGSIKGFMNRIGKSDYVLMLISNEYIKSEYCMYEATELLNSHEFENRILPVTTDNSRSIFNRKTREQYYEFWKNELLDVEEQLSRHTNLDFIEQKKKIERIYNNLDLFFSKIADLNTISYEDLKSQTYLPILNLIGINNSELPGRDISGSETNESLQLNKNELRSINTYQMTYSEKFILAENNFHELISNNFKTRYKIYRDRRIENDDFHLLLTTPIKSETDIIIEIKFSEKRIGSEYSFRMLENIRHLLKTYQSKVKTKAIARLALILTTEALRHKSKNPMSIYERTVDLVNHENMNLRHSDIYISIFEFERINSYTKEDIIELLQI